jgi:hypothetical protein
MPVSHASLSITAGATITAGTGAGTPVGATITNTLGLGILVQTPWNIGTTALTAQGTLSYDTSADQTNWNSLYAVTTGTVANSSGVFSAIIPKEAMYVRLSGGGNTGQPVTIGVSDGQQLLTTA